MFALVRKEIAGFFNGLTGYVVITVFLLINSLFLWVFPGEWNILDSGYASLDSFFILSPWVFLFLVPAVTMRMISEEKQSGTLEILHTQPLTSRQIIAGKYLASVLLVLLALLPCILFYFTVWVLGETAGNLDHAGYWGSFLGLFFLASAYSAVGLMASAITENQIVAFVLGILFCFLLFFGFDSFALIPGLRPLDEFLLRLGINEHYESLSRGVIDIRDLLYFVFLILLFTELSAYLIHRQARKLRGPGLTRLLAALGFILLLAIASSFLRFRIDLTADKRYTLNAQTKELLNELDEEVYIEVFLDGDMPLAFRKLKNAVGDMLEEFRAWSGNQIAFSFINPGRSEDAREREAYYMELVNKGLKPINIQDRDKEGGTVQKMLVPGMILNYNGIEMPVNFLKNNPLATPEQNLNHSLEGLEYEIIQPLKTLMADTVYRIAFLEGQEEYQEIEVADITLDLARFFTIDRGSLNGQPGILDQYAAVVIAGPQKAFTEEDKYVIDQYIMQGGRVLWLVEEVQARADSLQMGKTIATYEPLNLEDQLFRYGVRINPVLLQDFDCMTIPISTSTAGGQRQTLPVPWLYYPLLSPNPAHPITRNINKVKGEYVNYIDTVGRDTALRKKVLLTSSDYTRKVSPPVLIRLQDFRTPPPEEEFSNARLPVAVLLEGRFTSVFKNRLTRRFSNAETLTLSKPTRMIVVADGDVIRNRVQRQGSRLMPVDLGADPISLQVYGNTDFLVNALNYLVDDRGILELRSRELKLRLLDAQRVKEQRGRWQIVNTVLPVLLLLLAGFIHHQIRLRKYAR